MLVRSAPVLAGEFLLTAVADTVAGAHRLAILDLTPSLIPENSGRLDVPLTLEPGPFPVFWGIVSGSTAEDPVYYAIVSDRFGHGETVYFDSSLAQVRDNVVWDQEIQIESPLAVGGAFVGEGVLGRAGQSGSWFDGWPRRPREGVSAVGVDAAGTPLVVELVDADLNLDQYIFPTLDGRLYGFGTMGESVAGWPLSGPARSAGSPAVGRLTGETLLDLVAIGSFPRITGVDSDLATEHIASVSIWPDVAMTDPVWPMAGGSPWRNGSYDAFDWLTLPITSEGTGLVDGSHYCYPSPLLTGPLKVRGLVRASARARAFIYNLEGEEIAATSWQDVAASEPFTIEVALDGRVTGMYLCRLVVENQDGETDHSVVQFAVVR